MVRGGAERFDRTSDDTHGRVFPLFAALQNDLQGPAMPSGARTQPQFSGHTYRFNRSTRVVHAKPRSATSIIRGGKQVDNLGVEIVKIGRASCRERLWRYV